MERENTISELERLILDKAREIGKLKNEPEQNVKDVLALIEIYKTFAC